MLSRNELNDLAKSIKRDFPIFEIHPGLVYLDNAATTQKPASVIERQSRFYDHSNANVHRAVHSLAEEATDLYEQARQRIASFINSRSEEVIFTRGTTESINLLAYSFAKSGMVKSFVVPTFEHHSNYVPWQQISKIFGIKFLPLRLDGLEVPLEKIKESLETLKDPFVFSMTGLTNALGKRTPFEEIVKLVHEHGGYFILDGAQLIPHEPFDFAGTGVDFLAFSGHKMLGPMGIGVLVGKEEILKRLPPFLYGGEMIDRVGMEDTSFAPLPYKFEAGTQNVAGAIVLATAIDYLEKFDREELKNHIQNLTDYAREKISSIDGLRIYSPSDSHGIISFAHDNIHSHDLAELLSRLSGVAVRSGHHCAQLQLKELGVVSLCRASFYIYNVFEDVDRLAEGIRKALRWFA
ncbi:MULTISPECIES: aminotransferase class V-fold PLP-dependent enzyme [Kosmotoga]|uniref:cysteine desulfurase n=1 Tax=Kosmotoga olearia (strain ATCC BAA-1733 / DSM 21960 / TBF 19.5.1) TaxID=521045 RepID=C5CEE0_KOSOT|nr:MULTISPECIES: aminotransferase class V-fold PLP-dependent enzyme [Kosmotoga]ACR80180.1 cysteine desulfurase, SufS subfamily [Kosmotoga olearia TBF 19.5.1]MDI3523820.1 cysteine desulfurase / selenocysteine lyase [Kosmotoga sp.]MDK2953846.1 cysteine desulfurase / selenocysteine lyase [Kosmotoga sp.]OAA20366.1 cysteine desulfurase [Kosmotoga sp. DU53]